MLHKVKDIFTGPATAGMLESSLLKESTTNSIICMGIELGSSGSQADPK